MPRLPLFTPQRSGAGVVNVDDPYGRKLVRQATVPVTTYSPAARRRGLACADVMLHAGEHVTALGPGGLAVPMPVRLPGEFNVQNALAALVGLVLAGVPAERAAAGIGSVRGVPGRMERIDAGQPFTALVDYAHTPDAVETLLDYRARRDVRGGSCVCSVRRRPGSGEAAGDGCRRRPRGGCRRPHQRQPALRGSGAHPRRDARGPGPCPSMTAPSFVDVDRAAAIDEAVRLAGPGDAVARAKGHEQGQEIAGVVRPFDDRAVLPRCSYMRLGRRRPTVLSLTWPRCAAVGGTLVDTDHHDRQVTGEVVIDSRAGDGRVDVRRRSR